MRPGEFNAQAPGTAVEFIRIRGARVHNLRNIDLDIPRDQFVVITGPSGSGKSSLAFDTLFAEGQRQYIESLSVYARQFLQQMERPDVDLIEGLQPTICIDQHTGGSNPRSTVATVTEIYDYLRLLMARLGTPDCYQCGTPIRQQTPEQILERLLRLPAGTKLMLLAPLVRGRKGQHTEVFEAVRKAQFQRVRIDGEIHDLAALPELSRQTPHTVEAVVDRIVIREGVRGRLGESLRLTLQRGEGLAVALIHDDKATNERAAWRDELYSTLYACPNCNLSYEELEPRTFSFNSPYGACPTCEGLGSRVQFDLDLVVPDSTLSLDTGVIAPWRNSKPAATRRRQKQLTEFFSHHHCEWTTPLAELPAKTQQKLLQGDGDKFPGIVGLLELELEIAEDPQRETLEAFRGDVPCSACDGARLRPEARSVKLAGRAIHQITALHVAATREFFSGMTFEPQDQPVAQPLVSEILSRLGFLAQVGLDYLTLDRSAATLSGGESQRVRLATGIGSNLVGVCYILDEPSLGLHPRDNDRLILALRELQARGNSVLVVEHDEAMMRTADWLIDLGPGAGIHGGEIVAEGTPEEACQTSRTALPGRHAGPEGPSYSTLSTVSLTGRYLSGELKIAVPTQRRKASPQRAIVLEGATANNLKDVTARFPLGVLLCLTGVSGSGKSSLLNETLARALRRQLYGAGPKPGPYKELRGAEQIDKLVEVDQSPIGRTPRSNPATYTGVFDEVRKVFVATRDARLRGYKSGRFSFNVKGGRCEECQGQGIQKIEMNFLPDLHVPCPACGGKRFNRQTLEVRYRGKSIADVLDLRVDAALEFFANFPGIQRLLSGLHEVGLGYLTLGQSSTTLSGGEAQRIKLATELSRSNTGQTLYILDEPTTGLHFDDIQKLLLVLNRLVDLGNTVIVIEHHLDVIKSADYLLDLGPEGGTAGGQVLFSGSPEDIAKLPNNSTGRFLAPLLAT